MTGKLLLSTVMLLGIFSQSLAQVAGNLEWQDTDTFQQQGSLTSGETIFIDVNHVPELSGEYRIDQSGSIDLPLIGNVKAQGQTPASFSRLLEVLYEKDYLQNPKISVKYTDGSTLSKPTERSFNLVDIKTDPQPILIKTSSSLEGTNWSLGSDAREVIHFLSEGEMAGTVGCNNFFATYKERTPNIDIRLLGSTFLDCADGTKPKEFIDLLEAANIFAITQNELHLMDEDNEIVFSFSNNHFRP